MSFIDGGLGQNVVITVTFTVVQSTDRPVGLDLVKTVTGTGMNGKTAVISSSRVPLLLKGGENLPRNIAQSFQWEVIGATIVVRSKTHKDSCFSRFYAWKILESPSSLEPISSDKVVFLGEFGQVVKNNLKHYDIKDMRMVSVNGHVLLEVPHHRILIGGIAKTKTKTFSLHVKTEVVKGEHTIDRKNGGIKIQRLKKTQKEGS